MKTPKNLLSLSSTMVWQRPKRSWIFIMPEANDDEVACWMGSMTENPVMPHAAIRYTSQPSNPECFPAESTKRTRKGASMGK